jgi:hypothetical protein
VRRSVLEGQRPRPRLMAMPARTERPVPWVLPAVFVGLGVLAAYTARAFGW